MTKKKSLFVLTLLVIFLVTIFVLKTNKLPSYKKGLSITTDTAVGRAVDLYIKRTSEGVDLTRGPCLSNDLLPGWVADVVHSPRESIDDLPVNQCQAFLEGRATHFVELDLNGNLVRVR